MKKGLALLTLAAMVLSLAACGGSAAQVSSAAEEAQAAPASEVQATEEPVISREPEPVLTGAELEIREREGADSVDLRTEYTEWADEIVLESLQKLADRGAIAPLQDWDVVRWKIPFTDNGDTCEVAFLDDQAKAELTLPFSGPVGQVIMEIDGFVVFCHGNQEGGEPWFTPVGYNGADRITAQYADRFSDTMAECEYLICVYGCLSREDEDFYFGGVARRVITTLVLVVDPKEREILHIEDLDTDIPGSSVKMPGGNVGETNWEGAWAYLEGLLAQS